MSDTKQLYGWYSDLHLQALPDSYGIYATPDGSQVKVTNVCHSSSDPGIYAWRDARCVGPVTKLFKMAPVDYLKRPSHLTRLKDIYYRRISEDRAFIKSQSQDKAICGKFAKLIKDINPKYH